MAQYQLKIRQLLEKLQDPTFNLTCDTYLNKFLSHIADKDKKQQPHTGVLVELPVFLEWTVQVVDIWYINQTLPPVNTSVFTLNLVSLLSKDELKFSCLNNQQFYFKLFDILKVRQPEAPPSVKLGYIRILASLLEHKSGTQWLMNGGCNFWEDVLQLTLINQTVYVTKESRAFIAKLLKQGLVQDENQIFTNNVVRKVMLPLTEIKSVNLEVDEALIYQEKGPTLQLISDVLEYYLENKWFSSDDFRVISIFLNDFQLQQKISEYILICRSKFMLFMLHKIMLILHFLELNFKVTNDPANMDVLTSVHKIMETVNANVISGHVDNVLRMCYMGQVYWNIQGHKISCGSLTDRNNQPWSFINQLLVFQLLPSYTLTMRYKVESFCVETASHEEFRDAYIQKIYDMMCHETVRVALTWRNFLLTQTNPFEMANKALIYVMQSRKFYPREKAATVFQALIYNVKDMVEFEADALDPFKHHTNYLCLHFEALATFIEEFHLTWKDSVETICVMLVSCHFLKMAAWPSKLVVKILKLMNIGFAKYLTPNLALLVDKMSDSSISMAGPLLQAKIMDDSWEVRDSALEVIQTVSSLSSTKFPSLQKVLMDSDLPGLVVKMATQDGESFVRATAIKCLQEMIQVEEIWNNALQSQDLSEKMRQILINETEGIVRVEAATFMCISYENNHFPDDSLEKVYETMIHSSTTDLHWEVKVRALSFWDKVIHNHLQHQGMIDGSFPSVTFSKEHRKIVTLTDAEIKKRLQKILGQLSCIGCLGVLISAIRDDCDMEVSKTAVKITQKLVELLKKYSINADSTVPISPQPTENGMSSSASISSGISGDDFMGSPATNANTELNEEIIDQIVNSRDVNLLQNVYTPSDYGSVLNYDVQVRKIVSPNEFLLFTQQDLNAIINEKKNWLNGIEDLGSLLDDMLKTYDDDVNSMDCY